MADWTRETPWRQGHQVSAEATSALGLSHPTSPEKTFVIIVSHDCDLAQQRDAEQYVEVLVGKVIDSADKDGMSTHAKNARRLHIEFGQGPSFFVELEATSKMSVDKQKLAPFKPDVADRLTPANLAILQMWLASRYRRSAFSDEFERRLTKETKLAEKIAKAVKPHGDLISGVFFDVDDGEEITRAGSDDVYTLDITILHTADTDFDAAEAAAVAASQAIEKAFKDKLFASGKKWQHIELRSCEPVSESVLTYQEFRQLKRWRLEHMSLAADPQHAVLVE